MRPLNILSREMRSKTPTPSIDRMVASGCCSVRASTACATHSHPAFVLRILEWCHCCFHCLTNLLRNRLGHNPSDHVPSHNAPNSREPSNPHDVSDEVGTAPLAKRDTTKSDCVSRGLSRRTRRCSIVILDGPPAAPRFADLTLRLNRSLSNWNSTSGTWPTMSSGKRSRGVAGLARNIRNVG